MSRPDIEPPEPRGYLPDTVLTQQQLAKALSCSVDAIARAGIEASYVLGRQSPRYVWKHVVSQLLQGVA